MFDQRPVAGIVYSSGQMYPEKQNPLRLPSLAAQLAAMTDRMSLRAGTRVTRMMPIDPRVPCRTVPQRNGKLGDTAAQPCRPHAGEPGPEGAGGQPPPL
jgi:hypothetical protein